MEYVNIDNNFIEIDESCPLCGSTKLYSGYSGDIFISRDITNKKGKTEQDYWTVEVEICKCGECGTVFVREN